MGKRLDTRLSEEDKWALERVYKKSPDWRARERAKTLLLLGQGLLRREVAQLQDLNVGTVGQTWQRWCQDGIDGLIDKPRVRVHPPPGHLLKAHLKRQRKAVD